MYLAGAGVGRIGLVDFDTIDLTNLQRQVFYKEEEVGKSKAETLAKRITELNTDVEVCIHPILMTKKNGRDVLKDYDFVIEATDNPATKYMIDELCHEVGKPLTVGGVTGMRGQVCTYLPGHRRFSDLFPETPEDPGMLPCAVEGVLGPVAAMVASIEASEAIKYLSGYGTLLVDRLLTVDLKTDTFRLFDMS